MPLNLLVGGARIRLEGGARIRLVLHCKHFVLLRVYETTVKFQLDWFRITIIWILLFEAYRYPPSILFQSVIKFDVFNATGKEEKRNIASESLKRVPDKKILCPGHFYPSNYHKISFKSFSVTEIWRLCVYYSLLVTWPRPFWVPQENGRKLILFWKRKVEKSTALLTVFQQTNLTGWRQLAAMVW